MRSARKQGPFKTKHLNIWVAARDAYFNLEEIKAAARPDLDIMDFRGCPAWGSLDMAAEQDLAAFVRMFLRDGALWFFARHYLPEKVVAQRENRHYQDWATRGFVTVTDGGATDFARVEADVVADNALFDFRDVSFDPWQSTMLAQKLTERGVVTIKYPQTTQNLSAPMKHLDARLGERTAFHDGSPVFEWCMGNVVAREDANENVFPRKERPPRKLTVPWAPSCVWAARCTMKANQNYGFSMPMNQTPRPRFFDAITRFFQAKRSSLPAPDGGVNVYYINGHGRQSPLVQHQWLDMTQALTVSAVWACVTLIANLIKSSPVQVFQQNPDGTRTMLPRHPVFRLANRGPNSITTADAWLQSAIISKLINGNHYNEIVRSPSGPGLQGLSA